MKLHELMALRRDEIFRRWKELVLGSITPDFVPAVELVDCLPDFMDEIIATLREDSGTSVSPSSQESRTAAEHGEHRLRMGFSLDSVVREYGALRDAIVTTARNAGVELTDRERWVLSNSIISGIAQAVTEYTQQRDA